MNISYNRYQSHRVYIDSLPGVVETPSIDCSTCLSYSSDDMWVHLVRREIGVASRRTIIRHLVLIETLKKPQVHFIVCHHELRKRGLECCSVLSVPNEDTWPYKPMSLNDLVARERLRDVWNKSGDYLPRNVGYISLLKKNMVE
jgi:hypothetical protein